jgi:hypothetical protein
MQNISKKMQNIFLKKDYKGKTQWLNLGFLVLCSNPEMSGGLEKARGSLPIMWTKVQRVS